MGMRDHNFGEILFSCVMRRKRDVLCLAGTMCFLRSAEVEKKITITLRIE